MNDVPVPPELRALHPVLARLVKATGACVLTLETYDAWAAQPGPAMVVFGENPERFEKGLDLALIAPELQATGGRRFRVGLLPPAASLAIAPRYAFVRWPAFVMLRDGRYLGAVDGIADAYHRSTEVLRLLRAGPAGPEDR